MFKYDGGPFSNARVLGVLLKKVKVSHHFFVCLFQKTQGQTSPFARVLGNLPSLGALGFCVGKTVTFPDYTLLCVRKLSS